MIETGTPTPQQAAIQEKQAQGGLRGKILAANDATSELVEVPEWGVTVEVRSITAKERALLLNDAANNQGKVDLSKIYPDMVIAATFDPDTGERVFSEADKDEISGKNGKAVERIADVAGRLSGMNGDAEKAVKND